MSTDKRGDELWTQEEVMEFGLGGEEEFCEMQIVEASVPFAIEEAAMVEDMAAVEETATYADNTAYEDLSELESANLSLSESSTTKSGRVRKKSAKLMEMEESFPYEKIYPDLKRAYKTGGRKSRASMSDYTIDETQAISNADAYLSQTDDKPVKVRFSLSSKLDAHDSVAKTGQRDKRKVKLSDVILSDADVDSDRQLVIDEPHFGSRGHEKPLRMKLSMSSNMTAAITSSDTVGVGRLPLSPKKGRKSSKRTAENFNEPLSDTTLPVDSLGVSLPGKSQQVLSDRTLPANEFSELEGTFQGDHFNSQPVTKLSYVLKGSDRLKDTTKIRKKRTKAYTAYMVWCSTHREKVMAQNPGIDFSTVNKMLGDTWHTIPEKEKMTYRRQARKMTKKGAGFIKTGKVKVKDAARRPVGRPPLHGYYRQNVADDLNSVGVVGTGPLDCAAHLKLLGESLTTIGSRLQEHRGKIAVQGSLSVLFDSLLCVLGTLMCMTMQVPELNGCPEETHASTLSNIAYIMPGVG